MHVEHHAEASSNHDKILCAVMYTQTTSKVGFSAAPKHRNLPILNGLIFLILGHLRSTNSESFRVAQNQLLKLFGFSNRAFGQPFLRVAQVLDATRSSPRELRSVAARTFFIFFSILSSKSFEKSFQGSLRDLSMRNVFFLVPTYSSKNE